MTDDIDLPRQPARTAPASLPWTQVFYWSVRRELMEHASFWMAPLIAAGVALFGFLLASFKLNQAIGYLAGRHGGRGMDVVVAPLAFAAVAVILVSGIVAIVYCQGALHGERRDRSILFWKSLPVSDTMTVLSKAFMPMVVLPPVMFAVIFATHLIMLAWGGLVVAVGGGDVGGLFEHTHAPFMWQALLVGLPYMALWYAPLHAWLIMFGGFFRRVPWLWAFGGPAAVALLERIGFGTSYIGHYFMLRLGGAFRGAFSVGSGGRMPVSEATGLNWDAWLDPNLWIGLVAAAAFLAVAIRLRRRADPI
jgi:ABC-2 type transport system permease protein